MPSNFGKLLGGHTGTGTMALTSRLFFHHRLEAFTTIQVLLARMILSCLAACEVLAGKHLGLALPKVLCQGNFVLVVLADGSFGEWIRFLRKVLLVGV